MRPARPWRRPAPASVRQRPAIRIPWRIPKDAIHAADNLRGKLAWKRQEIVSEIHRRSIPRTRREIPNGAATVV
ncbi:hypothetical protein [Lysobacter gummosus]|uniref:hypothetical protein n=1 Tax=Lysobacter gummosus TaxID=262324 RepID=UPI003644FC15